MKIGFFGGTFDPIHRGHLTMARTALKQFGLARIYFIPAFCSPHKAQDIPQSSAQDRLAMVRLAVKPSSYGRVSDWEIRRRGLSYTYKTLQYFAKRFPSAQRYLILGLDAYQSFPLWKKPEVIRRHASLLVAPRGSSVKLWSKSDQVIRMKSCPVSSTQVRRELKSLNLTGLSRHLPKQVLSFIKKKKLYGFKSAGRRV